MTTTVLVRDIVTSRVHRRYRRDGERALYATEPEDTDTSGAFEVLTDAEAENVSPDDLCRRKCCFPQEGDS